MKTMAYIADPPESDHAKLGKSRPVVVFFSSRRSHPQRGQAPSDRRRRGSRPMVAEEIEAIFKAPAGYLGPIGLEGIAPHPKKPGLLVILDKALEGRTNLIAGANKEEYHLRNITPMPISNPPPSQTRQHQRRRGRPHRRPAPAGPGKAGKSATSSSSATDIPSPVVLCPQPRRQRDHYDHGLLRHQHQATPSTAAIESSAASPDAPTYALHLTSRPSRSS